MTPAWRLVVAGALALGIGLGIGRFFYTPMLPLMQQEYGFDPAVAGLIASANFAGYLAGSLAGSLLRPGPVRLQAFRIGLVISALSTLAMGMTDDVTAWLVLRAIGGIASAFVMIAVAAFVAEALAPVSETGRIAWMFSGVGFGIALSGLLTEFFGSQVSSSTMWYIAGGLCVLALPFVLAEMGDRTLQASPKRPHRRRREPRPLPLVPLLINYTCEGLGYSVFATFIVAIIKSRPELAHIGDWSWVIVGLTGVPSMLLWAAAAERIGYAVALAVAFAVQIVGVLLPAFSDSGGVALLAAALFGATFMSITMLTLPLGRHGAGGRGFAILTAGWGAGQMIGPLVTGYMVTAGYDYHMALVASAAVLGFGLVVLLAAMAFRGPGVASDGRSAA
ncbi:YbfB/YjiJ family MFS transporter [Microbaculum marinum]|uniref:YbfB/YjiJ family MFS transporter n=1 Tax=Microbaculum marinum TaxID=1764581 RepID=A0AAW9S133_9HYPH